MATVTLLDELSFSRFFVSRIRLTISRILHTRTYAVSLFGLTIEMDHYVKIMLEKT
jgi:hypothetical protein